MLKVRALLSDFGIHPAGPGDRHYAAGWINLPCPFCSGNPGNHLGWNETSRYFHCFRCGSHSETEVIRAVLRVSWGEAHRIRDLYRGVDESADLPPSGSPNRHIEEAPYPTGTGPLTSRHESYLEGRGFDPGEISRIWGIQGTGPAGRFSWRILAPVRFRGTRISYVGRDITGKSPEKYKSCPKKDEVFPHKETLYGLDEAQGDRGIIVEGVFDVWRLGPGTMATFGTSFNHHQIQKLVEGFRTLFVMFDSDALDQAEELAFSLAECGSSVEILIPETDPADLPTDEVEALRRGLLK